MELNSYKVRVSELEKKQRRFDQMIQDEKNICQLITLDRDRAERESHEHETQVLILRQELEAKIQEFDELEVIKKSLQEELEELTNNQGTTNKNVISLILLIINFK